MHLYFLYTVLIGGIRKYLLAFSVRANGKRILSVDRAPADGSTLPALHGIRFISMSWVIMGHTWIFGGYVCSKLFSPPLSFLGTIFLTNCRKIFVEDNSHVLLCECLYFGFAVQYIHKKANILL